MRHPLRPTAVLALLLAAAPADAEMLELVPTGTIRHDRPDASYTGLAGQYASVGALFTPGFLCSGTLIGSEWVVTGAHCFVGGTADQYTFIVGGNTYVGSQWFVEPTWTGSLYAGSDIALLRLSAPVANVTPAGYSAFTNEVGLTGTFVGFGATGTGLTGAVGGAGTKRAGQNVVDATADFFNTPTTPPNETFSDRILMTDFDSPLDPAESSLGSATPLDLEYNVAGGDSGGGLFIDFGFGEFLAGVTSFLAFGDEAADADYGDLSGATRTSRHVAFIQGVTGIAPAGVPEPSTTVLLLIVASAGGALRLRRRSS